MVLLDKLYANYYLYLMSQLTSLILNLYNNTESVSVVIDLALSPLSTRHPIYLYPVKTPPCVCVKIH